MSTSGDFVTDEFDEIANNLVASEANEYLDKRLAAVEWWVIDRKANNQPADLRSLIDQVMREPNDRSPVIVAFCAAMWRLREMGEANADHR